VKLFEIDSIGGSAQVYTTVAPGQVPQRSWANHGG
jgi:hypothetical protein